MQESDILKLGLLTRLYDVFISGPTQIAISFYVKEPFLKCFMLLTGVLNILYNGHNFLRLKKPIPLFKPYIDVKYGKTQIHRLFNLLIMYPLFKEASKYLPPKIKLFFIFQIIIGVIFNSLTFFYNLI